MKKSSYIIGACLAALFMGACSEENYDFLPEGRVQLRATINSEVKVSSRFATEQELAEKCVIWISKRGSETAQGGLVRKYEGIDNLPASGISLLAGSYVAEGWTGDSVAASFDKKYYRGYQPFDVRGGRTAQVNLVCKIANVVVSVDYAPEIDEVLTDYTLEVKNTKGALTFEGRTADKGYFMMPDGETSLSYTLVGTKRDGSGKFTHSGVIVGESGAVKPATEYVVKVNCGSDGQPIGGGFISIEIDEQELLVEDTITIATAPEIVGYDFNISEPIYGEHGSVGRKSVWVLASSALKQVKLSSTSLQTIVPGFTADNVDLMSISAADKETLSAAGITFKYEYFDDMDASRMRVSFEAALTNALENGDYEFKFTAVDAAEKSSQATLLVSVSDAVTAPLPVDTAADDFSETTATLRGTVIKDGVESVGFEYREQGSADWIYVAGSTASRAALAKDTEFFATVTGLKQGTTYVYRTVADGVAGQATASFTTLDRQLPNCGFEDWNTSGKAYLLCLNESQMFWDTGNHGSSTLNKNVTTPDGDMKHSGRYSAKLSSQFVGVGSIGKFAAGNAFVGKYLGTDGTDGIIGFGRPFEGRPVKLTGYVKYSPAVIDNSPSGAPEEFARGKMDKGVIYVALCDATTDSEYPEFPVVVKTKTKQLFNPHAANIIAYGELELTEATPGSGLVEFEIPLEYYRTGVKPSYIVITTTASKGGDYFAGGGGSTMWIDDFKLIY